MRNGDIKYLPWKQGDSFTVCLDAFVPLDGAVAYWKDRNRRNAVLGKDVYEAILTNIGQ